MVEIERAYDLVLEEALGERSIVVAAGMGERVDPERVDRLSDALRSIFDHLGGAQTLDRELCYALCLFVTQLPCQVESWSSDREVPQPLSDALLRLELLRFDLLRGLDRPLTRVLLFRIVTRRQVSHALPATSTPLFVSFSVGGQKELHATL